MSVHVFESAAEAKGRFGPCALSIGNFDGVHLGHRVLLHQTVQHARQNALVPAVLTFHPHPAAVVAPERVPPMLCTLEERIRRLATSGIERVLVLPFTDELSRWTPAEFAGRVLVEATAARAVFVGDNFRFGHRQSGNVSTLAALGAELGFETTFLAPICVRGEVVSSSRIRRHVRQAEVSRAGRLLGRCFSLSGPVVSGRGIGGKQTVPTLNLLPPPGLVLPRGVFVTETVNAETGRRWPSITNVGTRPTFDGEGVTIETYLLSSMTEPIPESIEVRFRRYVRAERSFTGPDELKAQILRDVARAGAYWRRVENIQVHTKRDDILDAN